MLTAQIGALHFALEGWRPMIVPAAALPGLLSTTDGEVVAAPGPRGDYLLLDHRRDAHASAPARVEFWRCTERGEARVAGLFVLVDTNSQDAPCVARSWGEAERLILDAVPA
jgi:hypothetical protein